MKKILFLLISVLLISVACSDDSYTVDANYEKAEITGVAIYDAKMIRADQKSVITSDASTVLVTLKTGQDITNLKLTITASSGVYITPSLSVGYQDLSSAKTYTITSPGKSVVKNWVITVVKP